MAKILIVEDNQGTNKAICEYMKEAGHTLFSAFTGSEALKIFREKELDIIVLDIMLPEMSGIVVLHEIRKISNIPVIMLFMIYLFNSESDLLVFSLPGHKRLRSPVSLHIRNRDTICF